MAAKVKVDQIETVDGTGNITLNNSITMASNKTLPAASLTGTIASFTSTGIDDNATSTAIIIDSSENVGIGGTPTAPNSDYKTLEIKNTVTSGRALLALTAKSTEYSHIYFGDENDQDIGGIQYYHPNNNMYFRTNTATQLQITSDGRGLSQFTAKAWARFNGSGTPAFGDSHNCSSITDNSTGNYTINFTNNLANVNYSLTTASQNWSISSNEWRLVSPYSMAVGSVGIQTVESYGGDLRLVDHTECMLQIFGD